MIKAKHPVIRLIDALYQSKDILSAAYDAEDDVELDVEAIPKLAQLFEFQLLKRSSDEHFYLDSTFRRLLDKALRVDTLSYLSSDIGEETGFFQEEFEQYRSAVTNQDLRARQVKLTALKRRCRAISDNLIDNSKVLESRAKYNYGQTNYGPSRAKENNYYLNQLERLKNSYRQVIKFFNEGDFNAYFEVQDCITNFKVRAFDFLSRVDDTIDLLRKFQYQTRLHHDRTKKLKALANHLKSNPSEEHSDIRSVAHEIYYCSIAKPVIIKTYPDISNVLFDIKYSAVIQSIKNRLVAKQNAFHREGSGSSKITSERIEIETPIAQSFFTALLKEALTTQSEISASQYYLDNNDGELTFDFWLFYLISTTNPRTYIGNYPLNVLVKWALKIQYDEIFTGNGTVFDCVFTPIVSNNSNLGSKS